MESKMRSIICAVLIVGGGVGTALAQEPYRDELYYQYSTQEPYYVEPDDDDDDDEETRSVNCGEFRYWNGERCVDDPVVPPTS
jgi:hypothetical protein